MKYICIKKYYCAYEPNVIYNISLIDGINFQGYYINNYINSYSQSLMSVINKQTLNTHFRLLEEFREERLNKILQ